MLLEKGKLKIAAKMPEQRALVRELIRMRRGRKVLTVEGDDQQPGSQEHDDMVMAVALACWQAGRAKVRMGTVRLF